MRAAIDSTREKTLSAIAILASVALPVSSVVAVVSYRGDFPAIHCASCFSATLHDFLSTATGDPYSRGHREPETTLGHVAMLHRDIDSVRPVNSIRLCAMISTTSATLRRRRAISFSINAGPEDVVIFHIAETRIPYEFARSMRAGANTASPNFITKFGPEILFPHHGPGLNYRDFTGKPTPEFVTQYLGGTSSSLGHADEQPCRRKARSNDRDAFSTLVSVVPGDEFVAVQQS